MEYWSHCSPQIYLQPCAKPDGIFAYDTSCTAAPLPLVAPDARQQLQIFTRGQGRHSNLPLPDPLHDLLCDRWFIFVVI